MSSPSFLSFPSSCFYPIVDSIELAAACLRGGATVLQLRVKSGPAAAFLSLADAAVRLAQPSGAQVIVNDRADIARIAGAAGVHVGQEDLSPAAVRGLLGDQAIVGLSTHTAAEVDAALGEPVSYIAVGPIYATASKDTGYSARGLDLVRYAAGRGKPIVAIGGITLDNARAVLEAGASAVAVIGDLHSGGDPEGRTRAFLSLKV